MKKILSGILISAMCINLALPAFSLTKTEQNNYIKIERKTRHLHSRLSKKYTGYEYTITNVHNAPVKISGVSVWDNATGKVAYLSVKRTGVRASLETLGAGVALALPTLGISAVVSAVAVPFIIVGNAFGNVGANRESKRFDKPVEPCALEKKESLELKTMALRRHEPSFRVIFVNPITDENMSLELR